MFSKAFKTVAVFLALLTPSFAFAAGGTADITPGKPILTMINILTPLDGDQDALVQQLRTALDSTLVHQPGFLSGSVHKSLDSKHVVNYAQWADQASLEAFVAKLSAGQAPEMAKVFAMARPDYHPYSVVSVSTP